MNCLGVEHIKTRLWGAFFHPHCRYQMFDGAQIYAFDPSLIHVCQIPYEMRDLDSISAYEWWS